MAEGMFGELEQKIGYTFKDEKLLRQACTHSSYANEMNINKSEDYERLEFLGDAVLELVTSDFLFRQRGENSEGKLTKLRASMVCEPALAFCAREISLERYILLGKGEETTGGRGRDSIVSDVMESLIGAIYLDGGLEEASAYIHRFVLTDLEHKQLFYDAKTTLQEIVQQENNGALCYKLVKEEGPQHDKIFEVEAYVGEKFVGAGSGHSKKAAEQQAAYQALLSRRKKQRIPDANEG